MIIFLNIYFNLNLALTLWKKMIKNIVQFSTKIKLDRSKKKVNIGKIHYQIRLRLYFRLSDENPVYYKLNLVSKN